MPVKESARPFRSDTGDDGVLFLHGLTGSPQSLREWAERTADAGYRVSLPRLPGHGTTWQELAATAWQDWYAVAEREFRALAGSCSRVHIASLSMGGALALRLAERHADDVSGLVLVNPAMTASSRLLPFVGFLRHVLTTQPSTGNDIARPDISEEGYDVTPVRAAYELTKLWDDVRPYLDLVTCPLLLFRSAIDHVVPASSAELIKRQVSSMDITEIVLANSFHVATMDYDRHLIADRTLAFLSRQERQDSNASAAR